MRTFVCGECRRTFPMNSGFSGFGRELCDGCVDSTAQELGGRCGAAERLPLVDPTICGVCGRDNGSKELRTVGGVPFCDDCVARTSSNPDQDSSVPDDAEGFDLASELGGLFGAQAAVAQGEPAEEGTDLGDQALTDLFREFQMGVDKQLRKETSESHYNLGMAYKEMGLIEEAIAEFERAAEDESLFFECASMLGICFIEKGMPKLAAEWFEKGLRAPGRTEEEYQGLAYDLSNAYDAAGESDEAAEVSGEPGLSPDETGLLVKLSGLFVNVTKAFRLYGSKLTAQERETVRSALDRSRDALTEGRFDDIGECIESLQTAARLFERFPVGH